MPEQCIMNWAVHHLCSSEPYYVVTSSMLVQCTETQAPAPVACTALDSAAASLKPRAQANAALYHSIQDSIEILKQQLVVPAS